MEDVEDLDVSIKVIVVGNGSVGKTSLVRRFVTGQYEDNYKKTIGVDFCEKEQYIPSCNQTVKFMLWDTAGQEEFDAVTRRYYRGAGACVLAFSTTDRASFEAIESWAEKVQRECGKICMVLIQNKVDLIDKAVVQKEEAEGLASKLGVKFIRTCVKKDFNVKEVFEHLAEEYLKQSQNEQQGMVDKSNSSSHSQQSSTNDIGDKPIDLRNTPKQTGKKQPCCT